MLINAALELFAEKGLCEVPTSQISKKAGVATGTLFLYFKSKEELKKELYLEIIREIKDQIIDLPESKSVSQILKDIWYASVEWIIENPKKFNYINQFNYSSLKTSSTIQDVFKVYEFIFPIFRKGVEDKVLADYPPDVIFHIYTSSILESAKYLIKINDDEEVKDLFFEVFWKSIIN